MKRVDAFLGWPTAASSAANIARQAQVEGMSEPVDVSSIMEGAFVKRVPGRVSPPDATMREADPEQIATVLEQIADHSSDDAIRDHIRQVVASLRGSGFIIMNGPPQQALYAKNRPAARGGEPGGGAASSAPGDSQPNAQPAQ